MAKSILISIKPRYVADILNHKKTIEVRKSMPKCDLPIDVYIYCTKEKSLIYTDGTDGKSDYVDYKYYESYKGDLNDIGSGKVVAKFTLNKVEEIKFGRLDDYVFAYFTNKNTFNNVCKLEEESCLQLWEIDNYLQEQNGYAWHIDNLEIFDKPKELSEFYNYLNCSHSCFNCLDNHYVKKCNLHKLTKAPQSWCYVEVSK